MKTSDIKVTVVCKDNFSEACTINKQDWKRIMSKAKDDKRLAFHIGEKQFIKKEIDVVATSHTSIQFL